LVPVIGVGAPEWSMPICSTNAGSFTGAAKAPDRTKATGAWRNQKAFENTEAIAACY
jgi:hypothetical protein